MTYFTISWNVLLPSRPTYMVLIMFTFYLYVILFFMFFYRFTLKWHIFLFPEMLYFLIIAHIRFSSFSHFNFMSFYFLCFFIDLHLNDIFFYFPKCFTSLSSHTQKQQTSLVGLVARRMQGYSSCIENPSQQLGFFSAPELILNWLRVGWSKWKAVIFCWA